MSAAVRLRSAALLAAVLVGCLAAVHTAHAETIYVTDTIEIGIHESKDLDSVIIAVIPSGTPLTVVSRDGDFAEVRTVDGTTGWVDTRYVVADKPETSSANEYETKLRAASRSLGDARAEAEVLRQRVKELERDAATAASQNHAVAGVTDAEKAAAQNAEKLAEAQRALEVLAAENRTLKDTIAKSEAKREAKREAEREAAETEPAPNAASTVVVEPDPPPAEVRRGSLVEVAQAWSVWQWLLLFFVLLLAFALGGYTVDWQTRRRHGGFRI